MTRRVLICGAGVAGPALAYWLDRSGWSVTVVEAADGVRPGGQTVDLRGAGRAVVERMGLLDEARRVAVAQQGIAWVDRSGSHITQMPVEAFDGDGIISEIELERGDLASLLYVPTADQVDYRFGETVSALTERGDEVEVSFGPRGRPAEQQTADFDLVVGTDGPHSVVRRLAFGPEEQFVQPLGGYLSWFTLPDTFDLDGWYLMYNRPGLVASVRASRTPGEAKGSLAFRSAPLAYDRHDRLAQQRMLADRFAAAGGIASTLVAAMADAPDFYFDALVQVRMSSWVTGRITLVGDAGYCPSPLTGLGTSLALVGAYVLAGELAATDDIPAALTAYERRMRPYVEQGQQLPPGGVGGYAPKSSLGLTLGMWMTRAMMTRPLRSLTKKLIFSKADAIDLSDYAVPGAQRIV